MELNMRISSVIMLISLAFSGENMTEISCSAMTKTYMTKRGN